MNKPGIFQKRLSLSSDGTCFKRIEPTYLYEKKEKVQAESKLVISL